MRKSNKTEYSEKTLASYKQRISIIKGLLDYETDDLIFLKNSNTVIKELEKKYTNVNTLKSFFIAIVSILNNNDGILRVREGTVRRNVKINPRTFRAYRDKMFQYRDASDNRSSNYTSSVKLVSWETIINKKEELTDHSVNDRLIYYLYTLNPCLRLDYGNVLILKRKPKFIGKDNFLVVTKKSMTFYLNEYKTSTTYGNRVITFVPELENIIRETLKDGRKYLLENKGRPYGDGMLSKHIKELFSKLTDHPMTLNSLRHSYLSYLFTNKEFMKKTFQDKKKFVIDTMLHDLITSISYINSTVV
jgi:hypothetical protein